MKLKFSMISGACAFLIIFAGTALAKPEPGTVVDYDIVGFQCPAETSAYEPVELTVWIANQGTTDPGALLRINEDDALLGPTLMAEETVFDEVDKGKQKSTGYTYYVTPTGYQSYITWTAHLTDEDIDSDWTYCNTRLLW